MKLLLSLSLFSLSLLARDPFTPMLTPKESGEVSIPPMPSYFSEQNITLPSSARKIKKVTITYQNMDGSIDEHATELSGDIDWHFPLRLSQLPLIDTEPLIQKPSAMPGISKFEPFREFAFELSGKILTIDTPYLIRRDIALAAPPKILIDFQKSGKTSPVMMKGFETGLPYIKSVNIGTHDDFYRVTLELDGKYRYTIRPEKKGFMLELY